MKGHKGTAPSCPSLEDLGGAVWSAPNFPKGFYNPAIGYDPFSGYAVVSRKSNYIIDPVSGDYYVPSGDGKIKNKTYFSKLDDQLLPKNWLEVEYIGGPSIKRGPEDARLLSRYDGWYLLTVFLEREVPRARMALYKYSPESGIAKFIELYDKDLENKKPEKNWVAIGTDNSEEFTYVKEISDGVRGGTPAVRYEDGYLSVAHKTYYSSSWKYNPRTFGVMKSVSRTYTHVIVLYDKKLKPIKISSEFKFVDAPIEFATGIAMKNGDFLVSFGVNDSESWFASIPEKTIKNLLKEKNDN